MLFDKFRRSRDKFEFNVKPENYVNLNSPLPKSIPKPNVGCGIRTETCDAIVISWIVDPKQAMNYDNVEGTINFLRQHLTDDMGIVDCKSGVTVNGHKFIYNIRKMRFFEEGMPTPRVSYCLNLNVNIDGVDYFINSNFDEIGMTGIRDSLGFTMFQSIMEQGNGDTKYSIDDIQNRFYKDPYDETYTKGFLMNAAEDEIFDEHFSDHPLTVLRHYIKWVITNN